MEISSCFINWLGKFYQNDYSKFLYLFKALPPVLPKSFFKDLHRIILRFLWKGKVPWVKLSSLFMTFRNGGLKLPNFYLYYCVAQLRSIWIWRSKCISPPAWRQLEEAWVQGIALAAIPFVPLNCLKKLTSKISCKICTDLRKKMNCKQTLFRSTAVYYNLFLPPDLKDGITKQWYDCGIQTFKKLYEEDTLMSFEQLQQKFYLPSKFFFKYLQVRHYI